MGMSIAADHFTVADLDQFEGQNGRHELLDGALIVTPLGTSRHQSACLRLGAALLAYVARESLGTVFAPGRVVVDDRTALEPDVLVIPGPASNAGEPWRNHPAPLLVVEVLSPSTRSLDLMQKRQAYLRRGAAECWMVDPEARQVTRVRAGEPDVPVSDSLHWHPVGATAPFELRVSTVFD
jgi:Uma2 family endonuclease